MQITEQITEIIKNYNGVDYSKRMNWLARPEDCDKPVDTFYMYPSVFISDDYIKRPFADIQDETMRNIGEKCVEVHGGVFAGYTNVFAPLYRQIDPICGLKIVEENQANILDNVIFRDVVDSFMYYYDNYNNGKPFILAGHSQGTSVLLQLLSVVFKKRPDIQKNMVAAYLPGIGIDKEFMKSNPHLKFAKGEKDTGVIISWNTQRPNMDTSSAVLPTDSYVINPLNWKTDETYAPVSMNKGSFIKRHLIRPGIADAKINLEQGVLECGSVNPKDFVQPHDFIPEGSYHIMDYAFYFENVRENVKVRIDEFSKKQNKKKN